MKKAKERVVIHTPYIICNDMMYDTWSEIAACVPCFASMTNSAANNGNPFGSADYDNPEYGRGYLGIRRRTFLPWQEYFD